MKQGKNPTRRQRVLLEKLGLNINNWLIVRDDTMKLVIIHRHTGNVRELNRIGGQK